MELRRVCFCLQFDFLYDFMFYFLLFLLCSKIAAKTTQSSASINNCIRCTHSLSFSRTFNLRAFIVVFPSFLSLSLSALTGSVILDLSGALPCAAFPLFCRALHLVVVLFVVSQSEQVLVAFLQLLFRSVDNVAPPTRPFFQAGRQHQ